MAASPASSPQIETVEKAIRAPSKPQLKPHGRHILSSQIQLQRRGDGQREQPPTKRRRIGYACNLCRVKKNRCDGERPTCGPCKERHQECIYSPHRAKISVTQEYIENLRSRNRILEEHLAGRSTSPVPPRGGSGFDSSYLREHPLTVPLSTSDQTSSPYSTAHRNYEAAPFPEEQQRLLLPSIRHLGAESSPRPHRPRVGSSSLSGEYFGESSTFDFIAKVTSPDATDSAAPRSTAANDGGGGTAAGGQSAAPSGKRSGLEGAGSTGAFHSESLAESSPSTVVFGDLLGIGSAVGSGSGDGSSSSSDLFELPQRPLADRLVTSYFKHRHPLNPYLHEGTFRRRYERLWLSQDGGGEEAAPNNLAWFGLVNMVFAFGSEHVNTRTPHHGSPGVSTSMAGTKPERARFFKRAKTLAFSSILQARIEMIQALLLISHYLHASLELNHCWTVIGLAIRTAQELGLYLDPARFTTDVVEQEIRKRVWWGCFVIDRNISIKVGRRPTIYDMSTIQAGLPLAVDDEFLDKSYGYAQPDNIPSKLEYLNQIVAHCYLVEKVLTTLYDNGPGKSSPPASRVRSKPNLRDLLAASIQLDGALVAWQDQLPPHLHPNSDASEWHFERQRNVLMMRFLHSRLLIHRQTLLYYVSRRISDPFQLDLIHPCLRRCIMAACDSITQVQLVRQYNLLSSSWHNSHYVFTAMGVLLVYQHLDPDSRAKVNLPSSLNLDDIIGQGLENLQRVGGEIHPLASRYTHSFQKLQERLQTIGTLSANAAPLAAKQQQVNESARQTVLVTALDEQGQGVPAGQHQDGGFGAKYAHKDRYQDLDNGNGQVVDYGNDGFMLGGFDDEFAVIESVLLDSNEWGTGILGAWGEGQI